MSAYDAFRDELRVLIPLVVWCSVLGGGCGRLLAAEPSVRSEPAAVPAASPVRSADAARTAVERFLKVAPANETPWDKYDREHKLLGAIEQYDNVWVVHTQWRDRVDNAWRGYFVVDEQGVHEPTDELLNYVAKRRGDVTDPKGRLALIADVIRLHQCHFDGVRQISSTNDIPGYAAHPLDADVAGVVRPPWSFSTTKNDLVHVVYTYHPLGGHVRRYRFHFNPRTFYHFDFIELGKGVGDYVALD